MSLLRTCLEVSLRSLGYCSRLCETGMVDLYQKIVCYVIDVLLVSGEPKRTKPPPTRSLHVYPHHCLRVKFMLSNLVCI